MGDFPCLGVVGGPDYNPRTMSQAATAAERGAEASARGRATRCNRGMGSVTPAECASLFLVGQEDEALAPNCARELGCSTGRLKAQKLLSGEIMSRFGKCANRECPNSKIKVSLPAKGLCGKCYARTRTGDLDWPPMVEKVAAPDPLEIQESPILDDGEVVALGESMGMDMGQGDVPANGQTVQRYSPGVLASLAGDAPQECVGGVLNDAVALIGQDHFKDSTLVPSHALGDPDLPVEIDGMAVIPLLARTMRSTPPIVRVYPDRISILAAATQAHNLGQYTHALLAQVVRDGQPCLLVKFYTHHRPGSLRLQRGGISTRYVAYSGLGTLFPQIGKMAEARLERTEWDRLFWVRFGGEAA